MLSRFKILCISYLLLTFCCCRQNNVRQIPINDFFKAAEKNIFKISPDGKYLSYLKPYKDKQNLYVQSLADGKEVRATSFSDYSVRDYSWTYNDQIVFTQDIIALDQYKMFSLDIATLKIRNILWLDKGKIFILTNRNKQQPEMVTIRMNQRDPANFDIYRLNIVTGQLTPYLINPGNFTEWFPDDDGNIRMVKASDGVDQSILYRPDDKTPFRTILTSNFKNYVEPVAFSGVNNNFYALSNLDRDKTALVEINAENGKELRTILACDKADIDRVEYSKNKHRLELITYEEDKPRKLFLNKEMQGIYLKLANQLHNTEINIVNRDTAENKFIVSTYTDRNPGTYYLYERTTAKLTKLGDINTSIQPDELCAMQPVSFKARDGMEINGYLTLPLKKNQTNLPVVVMVHDGAWGRRDHWGYSDEVQFLANRGYAVFQVNYRGSTGYGKAFYSAGLKQAGGKIQDDITDGVKWLIDKKIADPQKIAIYGGGFGGFSALYGVANHQGLYNCAVVQYGLINFFTFIKDVPPYVKPRLQMIYEMIGNPEKDAEQLRAISPVFHTDKIKVPVLIFQGGKDESANISEMNQFVRELKNHGVPVTYYLKTNERKGFRNEHNRTEMYAEIERFLSNNMRVKP